MSLPANWTLVPVIWPALVGHDGRPCQGTVVFTSAQVVTAGGGTYVPAPISAAVVDGVMEAVSLPSTDDGDISPTGWTWRVTVLTQPAGPVPFDIVVPAAGGTINLATVVPAGTLPPPVPASYVPLTQKGTAGGVATLDGSGVLPDPQIPATIARDSEVVLLSLVDAKGDLLVGSGDGAVVRVPVGANGRLLVADSAQTAGVGWSATSHLEGTGSPEGAVTAGIGSTYRDTDATNGAVLWTKTSGTGNTGWQVISGDTGWRNITALLVNGWTAGNVFIRRVGNQVTLRVEALNGSANTNNTALPLPTGFAPSNPSNGFPRALLHTASVTPTTKRTAVVGTNWQCLANVPEASVLYGEQAWISFVAWPAVLPGTAA